MSGGRKRTQSDKAKELEAEFEISPILDPNDFISYLAKAVSISKFWLTFNRPNPFDVDSDFVQPMQNLLNASDGKKGKTEIKGDNLAADKLEALARSAASTGNEAVAFMKLDQDKPRVRKKLSGNSIIIDHEDLADDQQRKNLLIRIRETYRRIRGTSEDRNE